MVRQVPLQWPGAIPRLRPVDCSATPSYSMKWRPHADHGQKHETGDRMHSELDDQRPITEAAEPRREKTKAGAESQHAVVADDTVSASLARMEAGLTRQREFSPAMRAFLARQNSRVTRSLCRPAVSLAASEAARCRFATKTI